MDSTFQVSPPLFGQKVRRVILGLWRQRGHNYSGETVYHVLDTGQYTFDKPIAFML